MNTEIQIFNTYDPNENKKAWIKYMGKIIKSKAYKTNTLKKSYIGIYFDELKDVYVLHRISVGGESSVRDFYSYDMMMLYIHIYFI